MKPVCRHCCFRLCHAAVWFHCHAPRMGLPGSLKRGSGEGLAAAAANAQPVVV